MKRKTISATPKAAKSSQLRRGTPSSRTQIDWQSIDAMDDREIARQVRGNSDAAPILRKGELLRKLRSGKARVVMPAPDVAEIRRSLGMSQAKFAEAYMLQVSTVRNWEQGRNVPDGPAALYLQLIRSKPREIRKALTEMASGRE